MKALAVLHGARLSRDMIQATVPSKVAFWSLFIQELTLFFTHYLTPYADSNVSLTFSY